MTSLQETVKFVLLDSRFHYKWISDVTFVEHLLITYTSMVCTNISTFNTHMTTMLDISNIITNTATGDVFTIHPNRKKLHLDDGKRIRVVFYFITTSNIKHLHGNTQWLEAYHVRIVPLRYNKTSQIDHNMSSNVINERTIQTGVDEQTGHTHDKTGQE